MPVTAVRPTSAPGRSRDRRLHRNWSAKHPAQAERKRGGPLTQAMRDKLKRAGWRSRYRLRKQVVEPVFGPIKRQEGSDSSCYAASTK